jgi:Raf kinase inhibitor-like YbhB/YbcL family protein
MVNETGALASALRVAGQGVKPVREASTGGMSGTSMAHNQTLAVALLAGWLGAPTGASALSLTSPEVKSDGRIADEQVGDRFGCTSANVSPRLDWSDAPRGARSFAVTMFDPGALGGRGFWHWAIFDIPAGATSLAKGAGDPKSDKRPNGAAQSRSDAETHGYFGPCPPKGDKPHHYRITLYAVDVDKLGADANATAALVASSLRDHTLAKATLIGLYGR